ncbi:MAG: phenylalanine--tRNA ligase subunit beta [Bacteroidota bacterium]
MKISYKWLNSIVKSNYSSEQIATLLTSSGLEVEGVEQYETVKGGLKGLVIGQVLECTKHPDADKLKLTKVTIGNNQVLDIVCGAPNVEAGQKVVVATVGAKLFPNTGEPFEIKKSKIRGAVSEGMLCAEDEIGLGSSHAGIIVLPENVNVGESVSTFYQLDNDDVFEIGLTPNRSDAASHLGVARDLIAIHNSKNPGSPLTINLSHLQSLPEAGTVNNVSINVMDNLACPRYSGLIISGITVKDSPDWLKQALNAIGVKPINNIVDVTNYVLHHLGQPLHAFDLNAIEGKEVNVRFANDNERLITLDGIERELKKSDLVIANSKEVMCLAGVFGGKQSGVSSATTSIFLESAYFDAGVVRKTAKTHGLKTDSSFRFERGTDPEMTVTALTMAANLIFELAGGFLSMDIKDHYPEKLAPYKIAFSFTNCNALIGKAIDKGIIKSIITNLGIEIENEGNDALLLNVPRYKTDVTREADVIEEIMRIYGYNNVEVSKAISYTAFNESYNYAGSTEYELSNLLIGFGFNEMMNLSLISDKYFDQKEQLVYVVNPLSSDLNVMRSDLIHSGLEAITYNINRKSNDLKLFEFGRTYVKSGSADTPYTEQKQLSVFITGQFLAENTNGLALQSDIYHLKNIITQLLLKCGITEVKTELSNNPKFEYGIALMHNGSIIAEVGKLGKVILNAHDIDQAVFCAILNVERLVKQKSKQKIVFEELSKFPSVRRDLALLIDKSVQYEHLREIAFTTEKKLLKDVNIFDIYEGEKLAGKKSYALSFTLENTEATLTEKQIDGVMEKLIKNYKEKVSAELR